MVTIFNTKLCPLPGWWSCKRCGCWSSNSESHCRNCGRNRAGTPQPTGDAHPAAIERKPAPEPAAATGPRMTKTEQRYAAILAVRLAAGEIREWSRPAPTLKPHGIRYTPDFEVIHLDGHKEQIEVKGAYKLHSHGAARRGFAASRDRYPEFAWTWATWMGGEWVYERWERKTGKRRLIHGDE